MVETRYSNQQESPQNPCYQRWFKTFFYQSYTIYYNTMYCTDEVRSFARRESFEPSDLEVEVIRGESFLEDVERKVGISLAAGLKGSSKSG